MGLYDMPLSMSLLGFGMRTVLANFHTCGIILLLRAVFNLIVRNASPRWFICFRCLIFSLSGVVIFTLFYCLLDLSCGKCNFISLYFLCCSVCLVCLTVFVNC